MKYTALIPTFNRAHCVGDAIESALSQTLAPHEVIVVDDGSTDDTARVLGAFGNRIRVIRQDNSGVSAARNAGIAAASGDWIAFLDSDDVWLPHKMKTQSDGLARHPRAVASVCNCEMRTGAVAQNMFEVRGRGLTTEMIERPLRLVLASCFFTPGIVVSSDVARRSEPFDTRKSVHEDIEWLARLSLMGPFDCQADPLFAVRRVDGTEESLSGAVRSDPDRWFSTLAVVYRGLLQDPRIIPEERAELRTRLAGALLDLAGARWSEGRYRDAARPMLESLRRRPSVITLARACIVPLGLSGWYRTTRQRAGRAHQVAGAQA